MADRLAFWDEAAQQAERRLAAYGQVIGHGDLDRKNVMWTADGLPVLIDWESAGFVNPAYDLLETAWYWAVSETGTVDAEAYRALIAAYLNSGGTLERQAVPDARLYGFRARLDWLAYNIRRSLGQEADDAQEQALGTREAAASLAGLEAYAAFVEQASSSDAL